MNPNDICVVAFKGDKGVGDIKIAVPRESIVVDKRTMLLGNVALLGGDKSDGYYIEVTIPEEKFHPLYRAFRNVALETDPKAETGMVSKSEIVDLTGELETVPIGYTRKYNFQEI